MKIIASGRVSDPVTYSAYRNRNGCMTSYAVIHDHRVPFFYECMPCYPHSMVRVYMYICKISTIEHKHMYEVMRIHANYMYSSANILTGMTSTFLSCKIFSAAMVVGPLAPSATT